MRDFWQERCGAEQYLLQRNTCCLPESISYRFSTDPFSKPCSVYVYSTLIIGTLFFTKDCHRCRLLSLKDYHFFKHTILVTAGEVTFLLKNPAKSTDENFPVSDNWLKKFVNCRNTSLTSLFLSFSRALFIERM